MGTRSPAPEIEDVVVSAAGESDTGAIRRSEVGPEAFVTVFDRHCETIHRYVHRRLGRDLADELAAETFTHAFRRRKARQVPEGGRLAAAHLGLHIKALLRATVGTWSNASSRSAS